MPKPYAIHTHYWTDQDTTGKTKLTISITVTNSEGRSHSYEAPCPVPVEDWTTSDVQLQIQNKLKPPVYHVLNAPTDPCNTPLPNNPALMPA